MRAPWAIAGAAAALLLAGAPSCGPSGADNCTPGRSIDCACPGGAHGVQTCRADGNGYEACSACAFPVAARDGFSDVTLEMGLPSAGGPCLGLEDFDGDGKLDLMLNTGDVGSYIGIYPGAGDGTFAKQPAGGHAATGFSIKCALADVGRDGRMDIVEAMGGTGPQGSAVEVWRNLGGFKFEKVENGVDKPFMPDQLVVGMGVWDYDQDGWIDAVVGRLFATPGAATMDCKFTSEADFRCLMPMSPDNPGPMVFHNDHGTLKLATNVLVNPNPVTTNAVAFADFNRDGKTDIFLSNDFYVDHLHLSNGAGQFVHAEKQRGVEQYNHGMGAAVADFNGDGLFDIYGVDLGPNNLWLSNPDGTLTNRAVEFGIAKATHYHSNWAPLAEDFDLDGRPDIFAASAAVVDNDADMVTMATSMGQVKSKVPQYDWLFWNDGPQGFSQLKLPHRPGQIANVIYAASAAGDVDGDGDLDIMVAAGTPLQFRYLRNNQRKGRWLVVDLEGTASNKDGIGAEVSLVEGGVVAQMRAVGSQGSLGQSWRRAHFGLGEKTSIEQVRVRWPSGKVQTVGPVQANQTLRLTEP